VVALGTVDLTGSNSAVFASLENFVFTRDAVLSSSVPGNVTITLPATGPLPVVKTDTPLTITGGPTALSISKIEGPGLVTITGTSIATLTITDVAASGKVVVDTPAIGTGLNIVNNAGDITVDAQTIGPVAIGSAGGKVNSGTITINASTSLGAITLGSSNSGTLTIVPPSAGLAAFTAPGNSGTITFDTSAVSAIVKITGRNTGTVNFTKNLTLPATAKLLQFPVNNGTINFYGTLTTAQALGDAADPDENIAGTGKVVFGGLATFGGAFTINIDCDTVFDAGLTLGSGATLLDLGGDVTLGHGQAITMPNASNKITLKGGKKLFVGTNPVLAAGRNGATITPAAGAVLEAGPARTTDDEEDFTGDRTLILKTAGITAITGDLRVAAGGILQNEYEIAVGTGSLTLEDGAALVLPDTANTVTIGTTGIAGSATAAVLAASGGYVSLAANRISGNGSTLAVPEEDGGDPTFTINSGALNIAGVNLDLLNGGSLTITSGNTVVLEAGQNPGKLTLGEDTDYTNTSFAGKIIAGNSILSGSGVLRGTAEDFPSTVGDIAGAPTGNLTITDNGSGTTIEAGVAVDN
jgi:hypothetical protein